MTETSSSLVLDASTPEGAHADLVRARDAGIVPSPADMRAVRARYLLALREAFQTSLSGLVSSSRPATAAYEAVREATALMVYEGTSDLHADACMFLLAELDELRKGEDVAYVVDVQTGEIVVPIVEGMIVCPDPFVDEQGITRIPGPILNPEVAASLALASAMRTREAEVREKAKDPVRGRAYLHLTEPDRILELARMKLSELGAMEDRSLDGDEETLRFGVESEEADLQSTNPFYHRLWAYSSALAAQAFRRVGRGGSYSLGPLLMERNGEVRWYEVRVRTSTLYHTGHHPELELPKRIDPQ